MKIFAKDLLFVLTGLLFGLLIWSTMPSDATSITVVIVMAILFLVFCTYFVLTRHPDTELSQFLYNSLFYIVVIIAFTSFIIDDQGYTSGIYLLVGNGVVLFLLYVLFIKEFSLLKRTNKHRNITLLATTLLFVIINIILVSN